MIINHVNHICYIVYSYKYINTFFNIIYVYETNNNTYPLYRLEAYFVIELTEKSLITLVVYLIFFLQTSNATIINFSVIFFNIVIKNTSKDYEKAVRWTKSYTAQRLQ